MENTKKSPVAFMCEPCSYECNNKKDYNKHLLTNKHCKIHSTENKAHVCDNCTRSYKYHSGLWKHKKDCKPKLEPTEDVSYIGIINQLLSQNNELKNFIIEQANEHKNFVIEQANEHKKETLEIVSKVIDQSKTINNNINNLFLS